jgi:hypothetical protein
MGKPLTKRESAAMFTAAMLQLAGFVAIQLLRPAYSGALVFVWTSVCWLGLYGWMRGDPGSEPPRGQAS